MPEVSAIEGAALVAAGGKMLGRVEHVLFDPAAPRAVALMVTRPRALGVVAKAPVFVPWSEVSFARGAATLGGGKLASRRAAEAALGVDMDTTVIWRGMPVATAEGGRIGTVGDVGLANDGSVTVMSVSAGAVGDIAHGRIHVPGQLVRGFDGKAVVVEARDEDLETAGGLAAAAAKGTATVKAAAGDTAKAAGDAFVGASHATGRALATAARSKPARRARKAMKGIAEAFREGRDGK